LVESRIGNRMRALSIDDAREYLKHVMCDDKEDEIVLLLDAISTNVTFFFREIEHFKFLRSVTEKLLNESKIKRLRIWSAASSTGEEPYSIAMTMHETLRGRKDVDVKILATDLSTRVLKECVRGVYPASRMDKIPSEYISRYFTKANRESSSYEILEELKKMVSFARLNLSKPPFPMQGPFDFIFCRNVMIYFDSIIRTQLVDELTRLLRPGGFLMVGHSETLAQMGTGLKSIKPSIYRKEG